VQAQRRWPPRPAVDSQDAKEPRARAVRKELRRRVAGRLIVIILPGTGRWQAAGLTEGVWSPARRPLHHAAHGPPPRPGEDPLNPLPCRFPVLEEAGDPKVGQRVVE